MPKHHSCIILRTMKITHSKMNLQTGQQTVIGEEIVTRACETPLFSDQARSSRICGSCSNGWEVEDNKFANEDEKAKALKSATFAKTFCKT